MTEFKKVLAARQNVMGLKEEVRSFSEDSDTEEPVGTQEHQDEADGLSIAAMHLANQYGCDCTNHDFLDHLDALHGHDEDGERAFAAPTPITARRPGMVLQVSKTNPKVRRWIRANAQKNVKDIVGRTGATLAGGHVGRVVGHNGGRMIALATVGRFIGGTAAWNAGSTIGGFAGGMAGAHAVNGLYQAHRRENKLNSVHDSAMKHTHYLEHHNDLVRKLAKQHKVTAGAVAHALSYHAIAEHHKQRRSIGSDVWKTKGNDEYHKKLAEKAIANFHEGATQRSTKRKLVFK